MFSRCLKDGHECMLDTQPRQVRGQNSSRAKGGEFVVGQARSAARPTVDVITTLLEGISKPVQEETRLSIQGFHRTMLDSIFPETGEKPLGPSLADPGLEFSIPTGTHPVSNPSPPLEAIKAEFFLNRYRLLTHIFPFVTLPDSTSLPSLLHQRPFLALGIFSVMSNDEPDLQWRLEREFRKAFSSVVIVRGYKSLDILQGLLVHLAWSVMLCAISVICLR
ncbi:hypothetical protein GQ53DRAFT_9045 [Thozetella sp. PMI_491]|nr:hypothetical protein GQ53DRAFT_9045 [Thozetella sp. PMI_491]